MYVPNRIHEDTPLYRSTEGLAVLRELRTLLYTGLPRPPLQNVNNEKELMEVSLRPQPGVKIQILRLPGPL